MTKDYPQLAFGLDEVDSCPCPAAAAGLDTTVNHWARGVADRYDAKVREQLCTDAMEQPYGTVPEATAKGCWLDALEEAEREEPDETVARIGRNVADKLGWLE